ncbi:hypothetical protein BDQ17DRAFT_1452367 [Cyathus striatus]|nr:hypothetical protein BDQ17DRAFT_1452367 [Cyathus striatus]
MCRCRKSAVAPTRRTFRNGANAPSKPGYHSRFNAARADNKMHRTTSEIAKSEDIEYFEVQASTSFFLRQHIPLFADRVRANYYPTQLAAGAVRHHRRKDWIESAIGQSVDNHPAVEAATIPNGIIFLSFAVELAGYFMVEYESYRAGELNTRLMSHVSTESMVMNIGEAHIYCLIPLPPEPSNKK